MRVGLVLLVLLLARPAFAQDRPWATGVSDENQARALELLEEGNQLFAESRYELALATYKQAIAHWDHPAIRFNMGVCYIRLEQPLEAYDNITRSLAYGEAPHDPGKYEQAVTYQKLLRPQIVELKVVCNHEGAEVTLDGITLFTGPGEATRWLLPGNHQVVASKKGFLTTSRPLVLVGGASTVEEVELVPLAKATRTARRWKPWKPWAVVGAGAGVALLGLPFQVAAQSNFDDYDDRVTVICPTGCDDPATEIPADVRDKKSRAELENRIAVGAFVAGGLTVAAGFMMVLLNQPYQVEVGASDGTTSVSVSFAY